MFLDVLNIRDIGEGCITVPSEVLNEVCSNQFDEILKSYGLVGLICELDNSLRIFKRGTLLCRNECYPAGFLKDGPLHHLRDVKWKYTERAPDHEDKRSEVCFVAGNWRCRCGKVRGLKFRGIKCSCDSLG